MKNSKHTFTEIQFTAIDIDGGDKCTDIIALCLEPAEQRDNENHIEKTIIGFFDKHPIISLSRNTWELDSYSKTGRVYTKEIIYTEISPREKMFEQAYPDYVVG